MQYCCLKCQKRIDHFGICAVCEAARVVGTVYRPSRGEVATLFESPDEFWIRRDRVEAMSGGHPDDHGNR